MRLTFRQVTKETWLDFERLFESPGAPGYCWCMAWRDGGKAAKQLGPGGRAARKAAMKGRIQKQVPVGILGYQNGEPVAWCSIAPRETYRSLGGPEAFEGEVVYSLACFFIPRALRGKGLLREVLAAAIKHAKKAGATVLEAYPVDEDSPSYRFMGFVPFFETAGFEEVCRAGTRRHVMRLSLTRVTPRATRDRPKAGARSRRASASGNRRAGSTKGS